MPASVTMINPVRLLNEQAADKFVEIWLFPAKTFSKEPGFLGVQLQKSIEPEDATFKFVNLAHWESVQACNAALAKYPEITEELWGKAPIEANFAIYEQYEEFKKPA